MDQTVKKKCLYQSLCLCQILDDIAVDMCTVSECYLISCKPFRFVGCQSSSSLQADSSPAVVHHSDRHHRPPTAVHAGHRSLLRAASVRPGQYPQGGAQRRIHRMEEGEGVNGSKLYINSYEAVILLKTSQC